MQRQQAQHLGVAQARAPPARSARCALRRVAEQLETHAVGAVVPAPASAQRTKPRPLSSGSATAVVPSGERDHPAPAGSRQPRRDHAPRCRRSSTRPSAVTSACAWRPRADRALDVDPAQALVGEHAPSAQQLLGHPGRGGDEGERVGMGRAHRAREVDDADQLAVGGSWIGAAEHHHGCWPAAKCSALKTCTAWSMASAVPIAFVPTLSSVQSIPSSKMIRSALRRTAGSALHPQDAALRVDDHHHVLGVVGEAAEAGAQRVDAVGQTARRALIGEGVAIEGAHRVGSVGVDPGAPCAFATRPR